MCRVLYTMDSVQFCSGALYPTPSGRPCQEALNSPSHREWFPGRARCRWSQFVARSGAGRDPERSWLSNTRQGDGTDPCKYGGRLSFEGRVSLLPVGRERSVDRNDRSRLVGSTINHFIDNSKLGGIRLEVDQIWNPSIIENDDISPHFDSLFKWGAYQFRWGRH